MYVSERYRSRLLHGVVFSLDKPTDLSPEYYFNATAATTVIAATIITATTMLMGRILIMSCSPLNNQGQAFTFGYIYYILGKTSCLYQNITISTVLSLVKWGYVVSIKPM